MTHTTAYVYHHMLFSVRGHPFMTSTRRGSGSGGRMWTGEVSLMWTFKPENLN